LIDIQKRLDKQEALYEYTQRELNKANYEQTRAAKKHSTLVEQTENYRVPEILDYVRKKALLYNLQRDCEVWQRKVEIVSVNICFFFENFFILFYLDGFTTIKTKMASITTNCSIFSLH